MVYKWEPWTQYQAGAVVEYEGHLWKVVQGHQSQPDWTPPIVPALFSRLPEEEHDDYRSGKRHHGVEEHHRGDEGQYGGGRPQPGGWGHEEHRDERLEHPRYEGGADGNQQRPNEDDKDETWLTEKRKHELEIGGGILAGALAIGGGVYAYEAHKNKAAEESKKQAWLAQGSEQNWQQGAAQRTQHYDGSGQPPKVRWVLIEAGRPIPQDAIVGGREQGHPLYIARTFYEGGLHVGKASPQLNEGRGGCSIAYGGKEIRDLKQYEVLVGEDRAIKWVNQDGNRGPVQVQGFQPVEGGREGRDGRAILVVQVRHEGGVHPGKYTAGEDHACFSYGGKELNSKEFNILAYE